MGFLGLGCLSAFWGLPPWVPALLIHTRAVWLRTLHFFRLCFGTYAKPELAGKREVYSRSFPFQFFPAQHSFSDSLDDSLLSCLLCNFGMVVVGGCGLWAVRLSFWDSLFAPAWCQLLLQLSFGLLVPGL